MIPSGILIQGDARALPLVDLSVQCVITSPPYWGLRDYGLPSLVWDAPDPWCGTLGLEPTPVLYVRHLVQVFREVRRVLRMDGTVWLNLGDSYAANRTYTDSKSRAVGNILGSKVPLGLKPKDLIGIPWRVAFALQEDGWYLRCDIIWAKPNAMPESVSDRPTKAHEYLFLLSKQARYYYDALSIREPVRFISPTSPGREASPSKQSVHGTTPKQDRVGRRTYTGFNARYKARLTRNRRSVWTISTQPYRAAHFATFPEALVEPCILAGCPNGGIVLDPFVGSGTVTTVARRLGRVGIGVELNPEYLVLARKRGEGVR